MSESVVLPSGLLDCLLFYGANSGTHDEYLGQYMFSGIDSTGRAYYIHEADGYFMYYYQSSSSGDQYWLVGPVLGSSTIRWAGDAGCVRRT